MCFRIKYDYGKDGSLEMRLYLIGAGPEDTGQYECSIPGLDIEAAVITLYITQGEDSFWYSRLHMPPSSC